MVGRLSRPPIPHMPHIRRSAALGIAGIAVLIALVVYVVLVGDSGPPRALEPHDAESRRESVPQRPRARGSRDDQGVDADTRPDHAGSPPTPATAGEAEVRLAGRIVVDDGSQLDQFQVQVRVLQADNSISHAVETVSQRGLYEAQVGPLSAVLEGTVELRVEHPEVVPLLRSVPIERRRLVQEAGVMVCREDIQVVRARILRGRVVSPDLSDTAGVLVAALSLANGAVDVSPLGQARTFDTVSTDYAGEFSLRAPPGRAVGVVAVGDSSTPAWATVAASDRTDEAFVILEVRAGETIDGQVLLSPPIHASDVRVKAKSTRPFRQGAQEFRVAGSRLARVGDLIVKREATVTPAMDGTYRIAGLEPVETVVEVEAGRESLLLPDARRDLASPRRNIQFDFRVTHLDVVVRTNNAPVVGATVWIETEMAGLAAETDARGRAECVVPPNSRVEVVVRLKGHEEWTQVVYTPPSGERGTVDVQLRSLNEEEPERRGNDDD